MQFLEFIIFKYKIHLNYSHTKFNWNFSSNTAQCTTWLRQLRDERQTATMITFNITRPGIATIFTKASFLNSLKNSQQKYHITNLYSGLSPILQYTELHE